MSTIGLPKGLLYYQYEVLWKAFFDNLQIPYIVSNESNLQILKQGSKKSVDEACLSLKIYLGHIQNIKDKCDYILIPRIFSLEKSEQVCTNFNCLYDLVRNLYPDIKILNYNIDVKRHHTEKSAFLKLGKKLGFNVFETIDAYKKAKETEKNYYEQLAKKAKQKLQSKKKKILLVGHPYNLKDAMIGSQVVSYLEKENIEIIYSYEVPKNKINEYAYKISPKVHWTMNKELLAAFSYFKDKVDGTIIISAFPCGPDSLTNEMMIRKKKDNKVLLLTFEDLNSNIAIITRLESFLDMMKGEIHL